MSESRLRGFTILTRCQTVEEFIDQFHDRTGPRTIFVHTTEGRDVGSEYGFAVLLANKKPVLAGTCTVLAVYQDANNQFKRRGMQLGVKRLGPESEIIFAALDAARELRASPATFVEAMPAVAIPVMLRNTPSRMTQPLRVVSTETGFTTDGKVEAVIPRLTERLVSRTLTVPPRVTQTLPIVQIPPREVTRAPRGTPSVVGPETPVVAPPSTVPTHVKAEGSTRTPETRTPGSSFILPANPLMDLTDASLEGFVDAGWGDAARSEAPIVPRGRVVESAPVVEVPAVARPVRAETSDVAFIVEKRIVEPSIIPLIAEPRAGRSWRRPLAIAAGLVLVAAALFVSVGRESPTVAGPSLVVESEEVVGLEFRATADLDPLPPAPAPAATPTVHLVLVKTYPAGALVTVNGKSFGTTPTFARVPAFTPVEIHVTRAGFPPVVHTMTSNTTTDRVFLDLRRR